MRTILLALALSLAASAAVAKPVDAWVAPSDPTTTKTCIFGLLRSENAVTPAVTEVPTGWSLYLASARWTIDLRRDEDGSTIISHEGWLSSAYGKVMVGHCGIAPKQKG